MRARCLCAGRWATRMRPARSITAQTTRVGGRGAGDGEEGEATALRKTDCVVSATFRRMRGSLDMNTFLKVLLVALLAIVAVHVFPIIMVPVALILAVALLAGLIFAGGAGIVLVLALGLVIGLLALALGLAAALAPIWIPVLAIFGIVSLIRGRKSKAI